MTPNGGDWRRLDPRSLVARTGRLAGSTLTFLFFFVVIRRSDSPTTWPLVAIAGMGALVVGAVEVVRYLRTTFRVGAETVELRTGVWATRHLTIPRQRVRRVELTSGLLHRLLGITTVTVGTGEHAVGDTDTLTLDAVDRTEAAQLRDAMLRHGAQPAEVEPSGAAATVGPAPAGVAPTTEVIERFDWRWAPYDVLSYWTLLLPFMALGGLYQLLTNVGIDPIDPDLVDSGAGVLGSVPWWVLALVVLLGALLVGVVGSLASFAITWWGYELAREPGRRIRLRRGLFTTRTTTFDEHRLRGVELIESLPLRLVRAGRLRVIAHGLSSAESVTTDRADALLPPVPTPTASRVAEAVLRTEGAPTAAELTGHPAGARDRRLVRAASSSVLFAGAASVVLGAGATPLVLLPALLAVLGTFGWALDAARSLGHRLEGPFLVARSGSFERRTAALTREGIIGWNLRQSWFQRRRGLATLVATTAAGTGAYAVVDLGLAQAVALARDAVPGLVDPLLEVDPGPDAPFQLESWATNSSPNQRTESSW